MSFQRILAAAKRLGVPLLVTDGEGREPVVILPLEAYETLAAGKRRVPEPLTESISIPVTSPIAPTRLERLSAEVPEESGREFDGQDLAGLTLEERFYVNPGDEGQRI